MGRTACAEPQCLYKGALYLTFTDLTDNTMTFVIQRRIYIFESDIPVRSVPKSVG